MKMNRSHQACTLCSVVWGCGVCSVYNGPCYRPAGGPGRGLSTRLIPGSASTGSFTSFQPPAAPAPSTRTFPRSVSTQSFVPIRCRVPSHPTPSICTRINVLRFNWISVKIQHFCYQASHFLFANVTELQDSWLLTHRILIIKLTFKCVRLGAGSLGAGKLCNINTRKGQISNFLKRFCK